MNDLSVLIMQTKVKESYKLDRKRDWHVIKMI